MRILVDGAVLLCLLVALTFLALVNSVFGADGEPCKVEDWYDVHE